MVYSRGRNAVIAWSMAAGIACAATTEHVELSLSELMKLEIDVGTLTGMERSKIPVSLTTITAEDIALTPARNINDLVEAYVPGAFWMAHSETGHLGIRGIISDRNGKFLLLVNGHNMGQETHDGAVTELENWDLNDVDRIEVIRGPGSVTYGPGAIMGVINIVTKSASDWGGVRAGTSGNPAYRSFGGYASYAAEKGDASLYAYASLVRTDGMAPPVFVAPDSVYGYVGDDWNQRALDLRNIRGTTRSAYSEETSDYFADYRGWPQGKIYLDGRWKELRLQARFTNAGNTQILTLNPSKIRFSDGDGYENLNQIQTRQLFLGLSNEHAFSDRFRLTSKVEWDDQSFARWFARDTTERDVLRNHTHNFSEKDLTLGTLSQFSLSDDLRFALGVEYIRSIVGPQWFEGRDRLRLGDGQNMFGDTTDGTAIYRGTGSTPAGAVKNPIYIGDGWQTNTVSFLGEANLTFHPLATFLVSGRADKHTFSNWGLSPRLAWIGSFNDANILKLIWQRSVRMNNTEQSYLQDKKGTISDPEVLTGWEAIYNWMPLENFEVISSGYYNNYEILGFNRADTTTKRLGTLKLGGLEVEAKYTNAWITFGINHSYLKQLDYQLSGDTTVKSSGISYSSYRANFRSDTLRSTGNDLNNWSNHATKLYVNYKPIDDLTLHVDTRVFWNFQGGKDGLEMAENTAKALPAKDSVLVQRSLAAIQAVRGHDAYEMDFRLNASIAWRMVPGATLTVFSQNLLGSNDNKRYGYDAGIQTTFPTRMTWLEEPRTYGARIDVQIP